jgi:NAD+ diphosphatase
MPEEYVPLVVAPQERSEPAFWFVFQGSKIAVLSGAGRPEPPCCEDLARHGLHPVRTLYLGLYRGRHCYAAEVDEAQPLPADWTLQGLRELFAQVDDPLAALAGRASQLLAWERDHRYCSRCGAPLELRREERARACPACGFSSYPPVSPAVMILVTRGRELLLARKPAWPPGRFSALAGFDEPGERLEDAVVRETREETCIEVADIRYFGSQPWPFPHSLMIAFTAEHAGGEPRPDGVEIAEARWFDAAALPDLPSRISLSRRLIDAVAARCLGRAREP